MHLFAGNVSKFHFKRAFSNPAAVARTSFRHNFTRILASLINFLLSTNFGKYTCVNVFVVNCWLPVKTNRFSLAACTFRKGGQALLIRGSSMISQCCTRKLASSKDHHKSHNIKPRFNNYSI